MQDRWNNTYSFNQQHNRYWYGGTISKHIVGFAYIALFVSGCAPSQTNLPRFYLPVTVDRTTVRVFNTPCELEVDFGNLLNDLNVPGKFDRHSVVVEGKNPTTGEYTAVDYRVGEHYKYGTAGKIYWLIENPDMKDFRVWFDIENDQPRKSREYIPAIGVGDELYFNISEPVPLTAMTANLLVDYNRDGITDVLSINSYSDRFGWPYDGIIFHSGIKEDENGVTVKDFYPYTLCA